MEQSINYRATAAFYDATLSTLDADIRSIVYLLKTQELSQFDLVELLQGIASIVPQSREIAKADYGY